MKIEKGMMFLLNKEEYIVGIVKSIKCSKSERYGIVVGSREFIWNNKTRTFSDPFLSKKYSLLSEDTLLVLNTPKVETSEAEVPTFELIDGDEYVANDGRSFIMFELDEPVKVFDTHYHFVGVTRNKSTLPSAYFTRNGKCSLTSIVLNEYKGWNSL